jgi:hypothetical protein
MNWFWLRGRRRRIPSASRMPHGGAGRLARGKMAGPLGCAGLPDSSW